MNKFGLGNNLSISERNQECTLYIGNLDTRVNEELIWELFIQCAEVISIHLPRDKITNAHSEFCFLEFKTEEQCEYALKIMNGVKLYGKPLKLKKASHDKKTVDVGATIFIGNLSDDIDEKSLMDVFSQFGNILSLKLEKKEIENKDKTAVKQKVFCTINFDSFDSSDNAIKALNNQSLFGRKIRVEYAFKSGSKDKHGTLSERLLSKNIAKSSTQPQSDTNQLDKSGVNNYNRMNYMPNMSVFMQMNNLHNPKNTDTNLPNNN